MKKIIYDYYASIILFLFIIYNIVLKSLKIGGIAYQIFMIMLIFINILLLFNKKTKNKGLIIIIYFFTWLFSKNALQCFLGLSSMIILMIVGFKENNLNKIISIFITVFYSLFSMPLLFAFLLAFGTSLTEEKERNDIYPDAHYYCEENYEVYSYSSGAIDKFHYSIGKHYEILNIDGIIYITYNERNEVSESKYKDYLKNNKCKLAGDINGSK